MKAGYVVAEVTVDGRNYNFVSEMESKQKLKKQGLVSSDLIQSARKLGAKEEAIELKANRGISFQLFNSEGKTKSGVFRRASTIKIYPSSIAVGW